MMNLIIGYFCYQCNDHVVTAALFSKQYFIGLFRSQKQIKSSNKMKLCSTIIINFSYLYRQSP